MRRFFIAVSEILFLVVLVLGMAVIFSHGASGEPYQFGIAAMLFSFIGLVLAEGVRGILDIVDLLKAR